MVNWGFSTFVSDDDHEYTNYSGVRAERGGGNHDCVLDWNEKCSICSYLQNNVNSYKLYISIMKTDKYTKIVLTVIAICLTINVVKEFNFLPSAYANETENDIPIPNGFKLVPINSSVMDVRIVDVNTYKELNVNLKSVSTYDPIKVNLKKIETSDILDVNLKELGGRWVSYGALPVKIE